MPFIHSSSSSCRRVCCSLVLDVRSPRERLSPFSLTLLPPEWSLRRKRETQSFSSLLTLSPLEYSRRNNYGSNDYEDDSRTEEEGKIKVSATPDDDDGRIGQELCVLSLSCFCPVFEVPLSLRAGHLYWNRDYKSNYINLRSMKSTLGFTWERIEDDIAFFIHSLHWRLDSPFKSFLWSKRLLNLFLLKRFPFTTTFDIFDHLLKRSLCVLHLFFLVLGNKKDYKEYCRSFLVVVVS